MRIQSTSDVSLAVLRNSAAVLPSEWEVGVDEQQMFMRAMDVPSWVSFVAEAPWWYHALGGAAAAFVAGVIGEAGKDSWRNRGVALNAAKAMPTALRAFVAAAIQALDAGRDGTFLSFAILLSDDHSAATLRISSRKEEDVALHLALFVHHMPALQALIVAEGLEKRRPVGGFHLEIGGDSSMLVHWMDRPSLTVERRVIPLGEER